MTSFDLVLVRPWACSAVPADSLVEDALGMGYLAAAVRQAGYTVAVLDGFALRLQDDQLVACIQALAPRMVGFSLHSFADYKHVVAMSTELKRNSPKVYQLAGGEHVTFLARQVLEQHLSLDAIVLSEGELTLCELMRAVFGGSKPPHVVGAMIRDDFGNIVDGGLRPAIEELDEMPRPDKDIVETALALGRPVALSLLAGRGCTHKCTFCTANVYLRLGGGLVWRRRQPEAVVEEMAELVSRYSRHELVHPMLQFQDVIFLGTSKRALEWTIAFLDALEKHNLRTRYFIHARADAILAHESLLPRLAESGLSSVEVGIESGVERILHLYNKRLSVEALERAITLLRVHGISYDPSGVIMFDPQITLDELRQNALFLKRLGHATWDRFCTRFQAVPGTPRREDLMQAGLFDPAAALDDVYAYRYEDERVATLVRHVYIYNETVHTFNNTVRIGRTVALQRQREGHVDPILEAALANAQAVNYDYFTKLVDLAELKLLEESWPHPLRSYLEEASVMQRSLDHLLRGSDSYHAVISA